MYGAPLLHDWRISLSYLARKLAVRVFPAGVKRFLLESIDVGYGGLARGRGLARIAGMPPSFLIIGAQRCGTTYLYDLLTEHPQIAKATHKEIHFFDRHFQRGMQWYLGNFPPKRPALASDGCITGEATPTYLAYRSVPARVRQLLPDIKLVALVRNPVDRAVSHYHHFRRLGYESRSFDEAISWEYDYLSNGNAPLLLDSPERRGDPLYLSHGCYARQLSFWLCDFEPEQILVLPAEQFFSTPKPTIDILTEFLSLPAMSPDIHRSPKQFAYPAIESRIRVRLEELFEPHNRELEALLRRPFHWDG